MSSEQRFGYEWNKYSKMTEDYERLFRNWTNPLVPADWKGKKVLDAGCGMGRNSFWAMQYGARAVTAFDYDERSVARAKETLKGFPTAEVELRSIDDIARQNNLISLFRGVIHHLKIPSELREHGSRT
jgi:2-polyprenyl-3-methyl-5-hydroxy-6-metoxy-1,4-benzoquinol methylase